LQLFWAEYADYNGHRDFHQCVFFVVGYIGVDIMMYEWGFFLGPAYTLMNLIYRFYPSFLV
jgi:hypothetical protein